MKFEELSREALLRIAAAAGEVVKWVGYLTHQFGGSSVHDLKEVVEKETGREWEQYT
jgi:hypothetical protein